MTTRITTLDTGLRVVSETMPHLETVSVGLWVDVGARFEPAEINGISHMLEHMAFKGTTTRSARAIAEEIEAVGGHLNAHTGREHTAYHARVLKGDLPLALDLLADILQRSVFDPQELARERAVVIQEIGEAEDTPDDIVFDHLQAAAFPDQPLGRPILGSVETVRNLRRETLTGYMAGHYGAPSMVLAAAGALAHEDLVRLAEAAFAGLGRAPGSNLEPARWQGGERRESRDLEQAHVTLGLPGVCYSDPDFYAAQVYATVLGGGMSSRLFQQVREERGLCYSVFAFASSYADSGLIGVYAGTGEDSLGELVPVIIGEMEALAYEASEEETARGRAQLKASLLMSLESSGSRCEQLARQLLIHGRVLPVAELIEKVDAVDAAALRRFAERVMRVGAPALAALGPVARLAGYEAIAAKFG